MTRSDAGRCRTLLTQLGYEITEAEVGRRFDEVSSAPERCWSSKLPSGWSG